MDFNKISELFESVAEQDHLVETIRTLSVEYQDKAITPERYAERVYGLVRDFYNQPAKPSTTDSQP